MLLPVKYRINWDNVRTRKQELINSNNLKENKKRLPHTYNVGDNIVLEKPGKIRKLDTPRTGPHEIIQTYTNGNVKIQRGLILERVNIQRVSPYHTRSN